MRVSLREFVQRAATELGITVAFGGKGRSKVGTVAAVSGDKARCNVGDVIVKVDPRYLRPTDAQDNPRMTRTPASLTENRRPGGLQAPEFAVADPRWRDTLVAGLVQHCEFTFDKALKVAAGAPALLAQARTMLSAIAGRNDG